MRALQPPATTGGCFFIALAIASAVHPNVLVAVAVDIALENGCLGFDRKFNRPPRHEPVEFLKRVPHPKATWTAIAIAALPFAPVLSHTRHQASWQDDNNDNGHYEPESSFYSHHASSSLTMFAMIA
jgi:hypothetical protein